MNQHLADITEYYDRLQRYYEWFWHGSTDGIHYGLRTAGVRGWQQEITNTNRVLADFAGIEAGARVVDAGCGVGGSARWLQRHRGCRVLGATVSPRQARTARTTAAANPALDFILADYHDLPLPDDTFDCVWGLESICYADKERFLREALRILKPGGMLAVADGFCIREPATGSERQDLETFTRGLRLPELCRFAHFVDLSAEAGFVDQRTMDLTRAATPSSRRLYWMCRLAYPMSRLLTRAGLTPRLLVDNIRAGIAQGPLVEAGVAGYFALRAIKPASG